MLIEERYKDEDTGSNGINSLLDLGALGANAMNV